MSKVLYAVAISGVVIHQSVIGFIGDDESVTSKPSNVAVCGTLFVMMTGLGLLIMNMLTWQTLKVLMMGTLLVPLSNKLLNRLSELPRFLLMLFLFLAAYKFSGENIIFHPLGDGIILFVLAVGTFLSEILVPSRVDQKN
ncbi:MAG: hypothetical protein A3J55_02090 [Candidatus Ryanbacteria bacterium RIFCSPHIGHO2_02_FULL_45_17b]|uniref:Uncharacterized protein n=1 Tax=Candidatus Ryanbacteria bacterium RIFCSPHIGHO2_01_FULL_45_22 TaxID=1802114 RepID=A0A1G2FYM3_9BACT|nr:MAG: hypothetical protein A2719_00535 [Candidatus Ryanbacteria bacterium RIFCSPHIGHO2_01_FULL_45_22]OGZ46731.1 MAG: hypothetical protein A3J55_02090 [Candidatus Ryanbacteria bacterium RIFCSPHIGHO2_02_FULL_45_17b]